MLFEPPPRPQDLGVILEDEEASKKQPILQAQKKNSSTSKKRHFDIYKDMNLPKACHILGLKDKEFREGSNKTLKCAFAKKLEQTIRPNNSQHPKNSFDYFTLRFNGGTTSKANNSCKRPKSTDMQLMHEAFQYLLKRKALQVHFVGFSDCLEFLFRLQHFLLGS